MAKYNSLGELFTATANAIRAKTGSTDPIVAEDFPTAVEGISAGGSGGDLDALIDGSLTELTSSAKSVRDYAFYECDKLTSVNLPSATSIGAQAFRLCDKLTSVNLPSVTYISGSSFSNCTALTSVNLPSATSVGSNTFSHCTALTSMSLPSAKSVGSDVFRSCTALASVNLPSATSIGAQAFFLCKKLTSVILRSETMCALANTDAFKVCDHFHGTVDATYNPDGLKDGYIYVPRALIEDYKVATNWVTFADQFRALEDYTVDGTTTGELDESKVNA